MRPNVAYFVPDHALRSTCYRGSQLRCVLRRRKMIRVAGQTSKYIDSLQSTVYSRFHSISFNASYGGCHPLSVMFSEICLVLQYF